MSVRLQIWSKGGDQVHATAHETAEEALLQWRATLGKRVSVLMTGAEQSPRRPTPWEEAASPNRLLASPGFAALFRNKVNTRPLPEDLESDYLAVVPVANGHDAPAARPALPETQAPPAVAALLDAAGWPSWFLSLPLSEMRLTPGLHVEAARLGIDRVRDLCSVPEAEAPDRAADFRHWLARDFVRSRRRRNRRLRMAGITRLRRQRMSVLPENELAPLLLESLAVLNEHQREALVRCLGLRGPAESLAAIGRDLSVTRERVRQIVGRAVDLCDETHGWPSAMAAHFSSLCTLVPAQQAFADAAWATGLRPQTIERLYRLVVRWGEGRRLSAARAVSPLR